MAGPKPAVLPLHHGVVLERKFNNSMLIPKEDIPLSAPVRETFF